MGIRSSYPIVVNYIIVARIVFTTKIHSIDGQGKILIWLTIKLLCRRKGKKLPL
jgi:hypothetical protein